MIVLPYSSLRNPAFTQGVAKLARHPGFNFGTKLAVAKLLKLLETEGAIAQEVFNKVIAEFAEKDDAGHMVLQGPGQFKIKPDMHAAYLVAVKEMEKTEFKLDIPQLDVKVLENAFELTAQEINALEPLFTEGAEVHPIKSASE